MYLIQFYMFVDNPVVWLDEYCHESAAVEGLTST